jgi:hypothetical protein
MVRPVRSAGNDKPISSRVAAVVAVALGVVVAYLGVMLARLGAYLLSEGSVVLGVLAVVLGIALVAGPVIVLVSQLKGWRSGRG